MSKREGLARTHLTRVKKRNGVGSRTITVLDSDEEDPIPAATNEYARMTKTRVSASGKAEKVAMSNIPIFEVEEEWVDILDPLESNTLDSADAVVKNTVPMVPAKQRQRANDSVSYPIPF